ncbi:MAG: trypsin-like peptidase domain-containing protein [Planctomycetales bacterium]|nr:trypsin-like peptidase domain-containing protein [Planctomycetales bacterium]
MRFIDWIVLSIVGIGSILISSDRPVAAQPAVAGNARDVQMRVVKIYGAGGIQGLEAYQSGFIVSPEGHIATAWSYVLDVEPIVVLDDGRRFESKIVGIEPSLELAVLKVDASDLPYFEVDKELRAQWGDPILAVSNLFGIAAGNEPASVMQGIVAGITNLDARRGTFKTPYRGKVLILDLIANNPGAAGGAVVDSDGRLVGMLGKELRDSGTGVWLNYALPIDALRVAIGDIIAGRATTAPKDDNPVLNRDQSHNLETLGLVLVPNVLESTPVYIDAVVPGTPAAKAKLRPDDLILLLDGQRVGDQKTLVELLRRIDRRDAVSITVQRDNDVLPVRLQP